MPRIKMTPTVRTALWALRIYLIVLLTLIAIKFLSFFFYGRPTAFATSPLGRPVTLLERSGLVLSEREFWIVRSRL
jgi:hypothetical protein